MGGGKLAAATDMCEPRQYPQLYFGQMSSRTEIYEAYSSDDAPAGGA